MKKRFFWVVACILFVQPFCLNAQFKTAMVGVNGLTCSACTRSVEMAIRKLDFVKDVQMNLENTDGKIIFAEGADADLSKVAKAVKDAGFSVRYLSAVYDFDNLQVSNGYCYNTGKYNLQFVDVAESKLDGESVVKLVGQEFLPKSTFNKMKSKLTNLCADKNQKVYYVSL